MKTIEERLQKLSIEKYGAPFYEVSIERRCQTLKDLLTETNTLLLEATKNLGHPAYGLSSGTTIAIDELREKSFDFLGIPKED